ncbi:MAG: hypothetical protein UR39_C0003G0028 [Candidatus Woesebacteria bacterium GW2011_GWA1_33_30]|uniref:Uncharacterized protein n=1 Tax=Candidatus Woesebacteria bacterium GW2011_GWA2_33_28 TaxID=1618561 RepID=A0A0G0C8Y1_9BACT|nr:MAG: hypothetical protein UR38_C0003G0030 [Candidatus Woesebacteria bacterium GW2011_GWA2_33_28]KKP48493.1 MAG: hypothetical protein UR39_C0003G0028 [Candidatus Woesebacteria bacterium GW2011_GWA1_33_30]KKP49631.1 MAG: hypothetical protein UR40_C0004G0030 [Microgenomates group bacterium GW2011_GWC1_33_32]KKP52248.1 MAG: hypothetical protein UR44_C0003G0030 [Candidatus Woesebacteria bacterium GW2011_GWB1_33_38]KKP58083.1 MAG: hypothetical protein UR48_C0008G0016 [Microgenomates group bacteriu
MKLDIIFQNGQYFYNHPERGTLPLAPKNTAEDQLKPFIESVRELINQKLDKSQETESPSPQS